MATATDKYIYVKGAPELVLSVCDFDAQHLDKEEIESQLLSMQRRGMRTLALCYKPREGEEPLTEHNLPHDGYTLQAIVAIADPVRPDVPEAVDECRRAGIEVKIVTGDNAATAAEIARQIDILPSEGDIDPAAVITGKEWQQLTDYEAMERVEHIAVMSRARPADKQRLVDLLRQRGNVVAVTGDGTNDAPALHHAHVGLSLGSGTSVAKSASDITLLDDSFGSISKAPACGQSVGIAARDGRFDYRYGDASDSDADIVGEPDNGHFRGACPGFVASFARGDEREATAVDRFHHHKEGRATDSADIADILRSDVYHAHLLRA